MIVYRPLETVEECKAALALEVAVWGLDPRDAVPVTMLRAIQHGGGSLLGAYDGERLVGIALAFPARTDERWILWSHMTGVDRGYQGQGIGLGLKRSQRDWALANGFDEIRWTFDPLQSGNAKFNLRLLGATAERYYTNFYGVMADDINQSELPSDRVEAVWRLGDAHVETRMSGATAEPSPHIPVLLADKGLPDVYPLDPTHPAYRVQVPKRLPHHETLLAWRLALRNVLTQAFEHGYVAVDFTADNAYLLRRG